MTTCNTCGHDTDAVVDSVLEVLTACMCEPHVSKAREMPFKEFVEREKSRGCTECAHESLQWQREHTKALEDNWSKLHDAAMGAIREALGPQFREATVPEMVIQIAKLSRARAS